jgi:tRNA (mo5U34)-methyltransferase
MIPFAIHRRVPWIRRPFFQRDQALRERDQALRELAQAQNRLSRVESDLAEMKQRLAGVRGELAQAQSHISANREVNLIEIECGPTPTAHQAGPESCTRSNLQRRIDEIPWYHEFDFPNGLTAHTTIENMPSHRALWSFMKLQLDRIDFAGKSVLDIGCWDGYWSFYAEKRGAARVLATDDATQNWAGSAGLDLAKEILGSSVETLKDVSVYDLKRFAMFDIILFMGVYYHLMDPLYALVEIRHRCHRHSLVVVEGDFMPDGRFGAESVAFFEFGHPGRCFVPTLPSLRQMLQAAYFEVVSEEIYHGLPEQPINRLFAVCRPIVAENALHPIRPPFKLHHYDPRWSAETE